MSKATNVEYILTEGLEEINLGEWEGLSWAEVKENRKAQAEKDEQNAWMAPIGKKILE